jgi:hypothetical protein
MNGRQRNANNAEILGSKMTQIMMAIVRHITSEAGRTKLQDSGFLLNRGLNGNFVS